MLSTAQEWWLPALRSLASTTPVTGAGVAREGPEPAPSCPDPLRPQHATPPALSTTQEWYKPRRRLTGSLRFRTLTGAIR